jgi:hypothetical protein
MIRRLFNMEIVLLEKLIELVKDIFSSEDDEIIYPIDEYVYYNEYDN